jgi:multidrug transporter EmrE-like cation transporter
VVTALAELYADYIGGTIRAARLPTPAERDIAFKNVAIGFLTAIIPVVYFVLAAVDAMALDTAFDAAIWTGVGVLGAYALIANFLAGYSVARSVVVGFCFTALGAGLVALKVIF